MNVYSKQELIKPNGLKLNSRLDKKLKTFSSLSIVITQSSCKQIKRYVCCISFALPFTTTERDTSIPNELDTVKNGANIKQEGDIIFPFLTIIAGCLRWRIDTMCRWRTYPNP